MTNEELQEIRERCETAIGSYDNTNHPQWIIDQSLKDIPILIAEIKHLRKLPMRVTREEYHAVLDENDRLTGERDEIDVLYNRALSDVVKISHELAEITAERDAAVGDITLLFSDNDFDYCEICKHYENKKRCYNEIVDYTESGEIRRCVDAQWRGVHKGGGEA